MLDIQELEPRSRAMCVIRQLDRADFERIRKNNRDLARQNQRIAQIADRWIAEAARRQSRD